METGRPLIKPPLTPLDKTAEIMAYVALVVLWLIPALNYSSLPDIIPIHFNAHGLPNRYAARLMIFILPLISSAIFLMLTILTNRPHTFNYTVEITEANAAWQYRTASRLLRYIKLVIAVLFSYISYEICNVSVGESKMLSSWLLPVIMASLVFPVLFYMILSVRRQKIENKNKL